MGRDIEWSVLLRWFCSVTGALGGLHTHNRMAVAEITKVEGYAARCSGAPAIGWGVDFNPKVSGYIFIDAKNRESLNFWLMIRVTLTYGEIRNS